MTRDLIVMMGVSGLVSVLLTHFRVFQKIRMWNARRLAKRLQVLDWNLNCQILAYLLADDKPRSWVYTHAIENSRSAHVQIEINRRLDWLIQEGYIRVIRCPYDFMPDKLSLTPAGKEYLVKPPQ